MLARGRRAALAVGALLASGALVPGTAGAATTHTETFTTPGCADVGGGVAANQWTVPVGVTSVRAEVYGATGDGTIRGGGGAKITGDVDVVSGETLYMCVGEGGGVAEEWSGGGYSSVSKASGIAFIVAGGGGGTSHTGMGGGGNAGTLTDAAEDGSISFQAFAARGATLIAPGAGGVSGTDPLLSGSAGVGRNGGAGGTGSDKAGGGGGGGYFGGGGGAATVLSDSGGGGGGSSFCIANDCTGGLHAGGASVVLTYETPDATTTTVTADPSAGLIGSTVTYNVQVSPAPDSGTVTVMGSDWVGVSADCTNFELDGDGAGSCTSQFVGPLGEQTVTAEYWGSSKFNGSTGTTVVTAQVQPTITASVDGLAVTGAPVRYVAEIDQTPPGTPAQVDFSVDGTVVCEAVPVPGTRIAFCETDPPADRGEHTLRVEYAGDGSGYLPAAAAHDFQVLEPGLSISPSPIDFGSIDVGSGRRSMTVTVKNTGDVDLFLGFEQRGFEFAVTDMGTCFSDDLRPDDTCTLVVEFSGETVGTYTGKLTIGGEYDTRIRSTGSKEVTASADSYILVDADLKATVVAPAPAPGPAPQPLKPEPAPKPDSQPTPPAPEPQPMPQPPPVIAPQPAKPAQLELPARSHGQVLVTTSSRSQRSPQARLPVRCPNSEPCRVKGRLTIRPGALKPRDGKASATTVVGKFSNVTVDAATTRKLDVRLRKAFVREAQTRGIRRVKATLTITTTFGDGSSVSSRRNVTLLIPKAAKPAPKPSFTG